MCTTLFFFFHYYTMDTITLYIILIFCSKALSMLDVSATLNNMYMSFLSWRSVLTMVEIIVSAANRRLVGRCLIT